MFPQRPEIQLEARQVYANRGWAILADLQKAHTRLLTSIRDLAKITAKPCGDKIEFSAVRFRVSEASLARRIVFRAACDHLLPEASTADQQLISRLRSADSDLALLASEHVNRWTTETVELDWESFCSQSKEMRRALLKQIELERAMLYPLLHSNDGVRRRSEIRFIPIEQFIAQEAAAG